MKNMLPVLLPRCSSAIGRVVAELPEQTGEIVFYVHTCSCVCVCVCVSVSTAASECVFACVRGLFSGEGRPMCWRQIGLINLPLN